MLRLSCWLTRHAGPPAARPGWLPWVAASLAGLAAFGLWVEFLPRPVLAGPCSMALFLVLGTVIALWLWRGALNTEAGRRGIRAEPARYLFAMAIMPLLVGAVSWSIATRTLPWLFTQWAGASYTQVHPVHTRSGTRGCASITGPSLKQGLSSRVCIERRLYHRYPHQPVTAHLTGKRSWFGATVMHVHLESTPCPTAH